MCIFYHLGYNIYGLYRLIYNPKFRDNRMYGFLVEVLVLRKINMLRSFVIAWIIRDIDTTGIVFINYKRI